MTFLRGRASRIKNVENYRKAFERLLKPVNRLIIRVARYAEHRATTPEQAVWADRFLFHVRMAKEHIIEALAVPVPPHSHEDTRKRVVRKRPEQPHAPVV